MLGEACYTETCPHKAALGFSNLRTIRKGQSLPLMLILSRNTGWPNRSALWHYRSHPRAGAPSGAEAVNSRPARRPRLGTASAKHTEAQAGWQPCPERGSPAPGSWSPAPGERPGRRRPSPLRKSLREQRNSRDQRMWQQRCPHSAGCRWEGPPPQPAIANPLSPWNVDWRPLQPIPPQHSPHRPRPFSPLAGCPVNRPSPSRPFPAGGNAR